MWCIHENVGLLVILPIMLHAESSEVLGLALLLRHRFGMLFACFLSKGGSIYE